MEGDGCSIRLLTFRFRLFPQQSSADLLSKVRGSLRSRVQQPQTSEKRGLRYPWGGERGVKGRRIKSEG
jgi:hypothetical protein